MSESVEFRAPRDGMRALTAPLGELSRRIRTLEGAAPLKQAGVRGRPGLLSSLDFDGDGTHADLGTQGWMLGDGGGGASFLDLNGVDVYASLSAQIATLTAQQATLTTAVANIATLVGQQTTGDAGNATTGTAASLGTSFGSFATITFNVPTGYTIAAVSANTAAAAAASVPVQIATRIAGADGSVMFIYPAGGFGNGAANFARVFSVTPGGTFTVETRALVSTGSGQALLTTAASVTFYR